MPFAVGDIVTGRISGVTKFGAFVSLGEGKNGLIHISEISKDYVEKVEDYVKKGDEVKVKILNISDEGKIGLSLRQAQAPERVEKKETPVKRNDRPIKSNRVENASSSFEDKLEKFLKESTERYDQINRREGKKTGRRY